MTQEKWEAIVDAVLEADKERESETIIKARKKLLIGLFDDFFTETRQK